ncbi:MAG TPA: peptidylprolyl isomerase [Thermoanaerobaculia bacterium]|nr:peptidylprolyl isomerase [Thermoanaerobaculia bacterium]
MRTLAVPAMLLFVACTTAPPPASAPEPSPAAVAAVDAPEAHGMTVEEEAQILALEDRRELDSTVVDAWVHHPNALHRLRIALALGRIGPHARSGWTQLAALANDPDRRVREMVAFSLGEIGDPQGTDVLFALAHGEDAGVAAEAVEALSKLAARDKSIAPRYLEFASEHEPEGVRARAVRFTFRWEDDAASTVAMNALASPSDAVRQEGAYSLQRRPLAAAREQLLLVMTDPNTLTRAYATAALGRIADASALPSLLAALGDMHPWVRTNAAIAIGRVAEKNRSALSFEQLPRVFASLEDPDAGTRAMILDTIGYYAESNETARKRLIDVLHNGTAWERELAAGAIAKHLGVLPELTDLTPWQIVRVLEGVAAKPEGVAVRAQYATHADPIVRSNVLSTIPDDRADAEAAIIRAGLTDADVIVRTNAIDRYGVMKNEPRDVLLKTIQEIERNEAKSSMNDARLTAIGVLARLDYPERADQLAVFVNDPDPVVRRYASEQLAEQLHVAAPLYVPLPVQRTMDEYAEIVRWSRTPHTARIRMTRGNIDLALMTQDAPMTTWNFAQLTKRGYFNDTSFMRVVPNFVIQGGDPRNDMNGGPGYAIRDEINLQKYTRGAVGMALSGPDTGGSQFFITHSPQPHLDGGYTIFGRVYEGMTGVVDQTERGDRVLTITIDETPAASESQISSVPNVSLPLEIGPITTEKMLSRLPDYAKRHDEYRPDITVLEMMKGYVRAGDRVEVYMGTWCSDSQREVPKFLRILDDLKSNFGTELPVTYVAVDRAKHEPAKLLDGRHIDKVATFIYYRGDAELGRIVEKPTSPQFEDDLLTIVAK